MAKVAGEIMRSNMCRLSLVLLLCLGLLWSCGGDDDPPTPQPAPYTIDWYFANDVITISNIVDVPQNVNFNKVKVGISGVDWQVIDALEVPYSDGKAVLPLPSAFGRDELMRVGRLAVNDYTAFWPAATDNADAKVADLKDIFAYDGDRKVGRIFLTDWSRTGSTTGKYFVNFHYVDQDVALSGYNLTLGNNQKSVIYEASFKAGWNSYASVNQSDGGIALITTAIPGSRKLYWRFESYVY